MHVPVRTGELFFETKRKLHALCVKSKQELPDFSPTAVLIRIFNSSFIQLLAIHNYQEGGIVHDFMIADFTDSPMTPEEVESRIRKIFGNRLLELEWLESGVKGLVYNTRGFPPIFFAFNTEIRVILFAVTLWRGLIRSLMTRFGTGGLYILWALGSDIMKFHAHHISMLKGKLTDEEIVRIGLAVLQAMGFGIFKLMKFSREEIAIKIEEHFEDAAGKGIPGFQGSFLRGLLSSFFSIIFGEEYECSSAKCVLRGDPYCELVARPRSSIEKGFQEH